MDVVELLSTAKPGIVAPSQPMAAIQAHLNQFLKDYGASVWRPKHHYALHLPLMLERFGMLIACFSHEPKHRVVKRHMRNRQNTQSLEIGTMEDLTIQHLEDLHTEWTSSGTLGHSSHKPHKKVLALVREVFPTAGVGSILVCKYAAGRSGKVHVGGVCDVRVPEGRACGEVLMLCEVLKVAYSIVACMTPLHAWLA